MGNMLRRQGLEHHNEAYQKYVSRLQADKKVQKSLHRLDGAWKDEIVREREASHSHNDTVMRAAGFATSATARPHNTTAGVAHSEFFRNVSKSVDHQMWLKVDEKLLDGAPSVPHGGDAVSVTPPAPKYAGVAPSRSPGGSTTFYSPNSNPATQSLAAAYALPSATQGTDHHPVASAATPSLQAPPMTAFSPSTYSLLQVPSIESFSPVPSVALRMPGGAMSQTRWLGTDSLRNPTSIAYAQSNAAAAPLLAHQRHRDPLGVGASPYLQDSPYQQSSGLATGSSVLISTPADQFSPVRGGVQQQVTPIGQPAASLSQLSPQPHPSPGVRRKVWGNSPS
jgi:hypothetical protein